MSRNRGGPGGHQRAPAARNPTRRCPSEEPIVRFERQTLVENGVTELVCPETMPKLALDRVLREAVVDLSWSKCRALIDNGKVTVNGDTARDIRAEVEKGSVIRIDPRARKANTQALHAIRLVYRDSQIVVVDKPSGISTVAFDPTERDTLDELTRRILSNQSKERCPPLGVVHRIDKETSGLLVFARTTGAKRHLKQQFRFHTNHRVYLALAFGNVQPGRIESRLVEDRGDGRRGSTDHPQLGQIAITHVEVLERLGQATLIRCRLETGRTHQIRIHLAESGHPLLGERVYGSPGAATSISASRLMLHAAELGITHPTRDEQLLFRSDPPEDFAMLLERLRASRR